MKVVDIADINAVIDKLIDELKADPYYIQSSDAQRVADFSVDILEAARRNLLLSAKDIATRRYQNV